jgi:cytochrome c-type biogenesis protein CcmH
LQLSLLVMALLLSPGVQARVETYTFDTPAQEARYRKLTSELRCLVCQNQNLADSNAELAVDMRRKTYEMVTAGNSEKEIIDFMVARYGDFVMYRPPLKSTTMFLWFGPLLVLIIGAVIVIVYIRKQRRPETISEVPEQQQQRAHSLLDDE